MKGKTDPKYINKFDPDKKVLKDERYPLKVLEDELTPMKSKTLKTIGLRPFELAEFRIRKL